MKISDEFIRFASNELANWINIISINNYLEIEQKKLISLEEAKVISKDLILTVDWKNESLMHKGLSYVAEVWLRGNNQK